ncbi:hypothetical protein DOY81_010470, partial [Sarcophaga bullata]
MPPKRKGSAAKSPTAKKPKMASDEPTNLKTDQPVFEDQANLELQLVINGDGPPRRGSFEVAIAKTPTSERSLLWTGLKNTPRASKFPVVERIADDIKQYLGIT